MNRRFWVIGVVLAVLLISGTYAVTSSLVSGQMQSFQAKPDVWEPIAASMGRSTGASNMLGQEVMNHKISHQMGNMMGMMGKQTSGAGITVNAQSLY